MLVVGVDLLGRAPSLVEDGDIVSQWTSRFAEHAAKLAAAEQPNDRCLAHCRQVSGL